MTLPTVVVALRDQDHVQGLMKVACEMSKGMGGRLIAAHVVEVAPTLPLDAESEALDRPGRQVLDQAREAATRYGFREITTRLVRGREAGKAIVAEAQDQGAELLVMGYHRKPALREMVLGSTVQYVAHHAPCRVIVQIVSSQP